MFTKKHFIEAAALIKALPKAKRHAAFEDWSNKFCEQNDRFDEEKFANACGFDWNQYQSEYRPKPYVYTPPPPETLAKIPARLTRIHFVCTDKPTRKEHWDVYFGKVKLGYIYKCSFTYDPASFYAEKENNPYYTLIRHIHDGSYSGTYRLCLILNAYSLNSDKTMSVDCTGKHLGWIVVRPDGLNVSDEKNTVCQYEGTYDIYKDYKKVGVKMPKFGDYTSTDKGIFIHEQLGKFYNQIAITHATVWLNKKDAQRVARKLKCRVRPLSEWRNQKWESEWKKQKDEARQKELDKATELLNK
jgi:hypothetical protein